MTHNIMVLQLQNKLLKLIQTIKKIKTWTIINGEKIFSINKNKENSAVMEVSRIKHLLITKETMQLQSNKIKWISSIKTNIKKVKNLKS